MTEIRVYFNTTKILLYFYVDGKIERLQYDENHEEQITVRDFLPFIGMKKEDLIHLNASSEDEIDLDISDFIIADLVYEDSPDHRIIGFRFPEKGKIIPFTRIMTIFIMEWTKKLKDEFHIMNPYFNIIHPSYWTENKCAYVANLIVDGTPINWHSPYKTCFNARNNEFVSYKLTDQSIEISMQYEILLPHNKSVIFIDIGYCGTEIFLSDYENISSDDEFDIYVNGDAQLGGRLLDLILFQHFRKEIMKYGSEDPFVDKKTRMNLMEICTQVKEKKEIKPSPFGENNPFNYEFKLDKGCYDIIEYHFSARIRILLDNIIDHRSMNSIDHRTNGPAVDVNLMGRASPLFRQIIADYFKAKNIDVEINSLSIDDCYT